MSSEETSDSTGEPPGGRVRKREFTDEYLLRMLADVITQRMPQRDIELLVRAGVRVNGVVSHGLRPLHYAVFQQNLNAVNYLCDHGALVNFCDEVGKFSI